MPLSSSCFALSLPPPQLGPLVSLIASLTAFAVPVIIRVVIAIIVIIAPPPVAFTAILPIVLIVAVILDIAAAAFAALFSVTAFVFVFCWFGLVKGIEEISLHGKKGTYLFARGSCGCDQPAFGYPPWSEREEQ